MPRLRCPAALFRPGHQHISTGTGARTITRAGCRGSPGYLWQPRNERRCNHASQLPHAPQRIHARTAGRTGGQNRRPGTRIVGPGAAACHTSRRASPSSTARCTPRRPPRACCGSPRRRCTGGWKGRPPRYRSVIRVEPTGSRNVTWAEFVEASLLRSYRREHDVRLRELRDFIDRLRDEYQVRYPLADRRPYVGSGRQLLIDLQGRSQLDPEFCLVAVANGQIVLTARGEEFFARVDWSGDQPAAWRPHEDPGSPVLVNPLVRFGVPAVGGISTEAIADELDGGASGEEVAEDFGLDMDAVRWPRVTSCRSTQRHEPAHGPGPHPRRRRRRRPRTRQDPRRPPQRRDLFSLPGPRHGDS